MVGAVIGHVNSTEFSPWWVLHDTGDQTIDSWI